MNVLISPSTFNATNLGGTLSATITGTTITHHIADLRGNTTLTTTGSLAQATTTSYTEYGTPQTPQTPTNAWHGSQQRTTSATTGLIHMGVRLYNSLTGLFLQQDPIHGGNPNSYTHPVDPINQQDLQGKFWEEISLAASILTTVALIAGAPVTGPLAIGLALVGASASLWNLGSHAITLSKGGSVNACDVAWDALGVATSFVGGGAAWKGLRLTHKYPRYDRFINWLRKIGSSRPGKSGKLLWLKNPEITTPFEWAGNTQASFEAFGFRTYRKPRG